MSDLNQIDEPPATSVNVSLFIESGSLINVNRVEGRDTIAVSIGVWPTQATIFFDNDAAYLHWYSQMQDFFIREGSAVAKVVH